SYPQAAGRLPHLLGVKRTLSGRAAMSAFDPKQTSGGIRAVARYGMSSHSHKDSKTASGTRPAALPSSPHAVPRLPRHGAMGCRTDSEGKPHFSLTPVRPGKPTAGRCRGSVGKPTPKRMATDQTDHNL